MIHEMTKLELEVRCTSSLSFSYLGRYLQVPPNKTNPFECPCVYIYIYISEWSRLRENKQKAQQEERKPNVLMTYFIPSY